MAKKSTKELRNLSEPELDDKLKDLNAKLMEFRFQAAGGRLQKNSQIKSARKDVARVLTIKKELQCQKKNELPKEK